jgi:hypothetical protein
MPLKVKVFISWSGKTSNKVALVLKDWLEDVIQDLDCFVSTHMKKGQVWATALAKELHGARYGIFCVTPSNRNQPWLNFEAGAISTQVNSRVSPFLINIASSDLDFPIAQYQSTAWNNKDDVLRLLKSINSSAADEALLTEQRLQRNFDRAWHRLHRELKAIAEKAEADDAPSAAADKHEKMTEEILAAVRQHQRALTIVVSQLEIHSPSAEIVDENTDNVWSPIMSAPIYNDSFFSTNR